MCGFCGFIDPAFSSSEENIIQKMTNKIRHRGPDDDGIWLDKKYGVALGHRRLSIIDLSAEGHQPMHSASDRYVLVYNGEIYNFETIRKELESAGFAPTWRGHSDTEVLLTAFEAWGIESTLKRCVGMFAFVLWDRKEKTLTLARDRMGEKPLYYGWQNGVFLFGSELKALREHPKFVGEIDRNVLTQLLRFNYIPAPYSIYKDIYKLRQGTILTIPVESSQFQQQEYVLPEKYWSLREVAREGVADPFLGSEIDVITTLDEKLKQAVAGQMLSDVPLGAFLSGGYDSSLVVALMQSQSAKPVRTFSIGFKEKGYNEAPHARAVARHLGTDHTELYLSSQEAIQMIPKLPLLYDEPFSDSSQIPTFLLSQMAREHVTVSLSGDGGDELFGGYNRYFMGSRLWRYLAPFPLPMRQLMAKAVTGVSPLTWDRLANILGPLLPAELRAGRAGDKLHKLASTFSLASPDALYRRLLSHWETPEEIVINGQEPKTTLDFPVDLENFIERMMCLDAVSYLPDDILVKVDRASMGVSLETRLPLLDHRVVEFAWQLPLDMKVRKDQGKHALRHVLYNYVPREMLDRPKMGFGIPLDAWLRGPLRDWAEALLDENRLRQEGYFNPAPIRQKWDEHLSGKRNWHYCLWDILMFQQWLEQT
jgi:asparagine synthase (glutamine-hydrolysing)